MEIVTGSDGNAYDCENLDDDQPDAEGEPNWDPETQTWLPSMTIHQAGKCDKLTNWPGFDDGGGGGGGGGGDDNGGGIFGGVGGTLMGPLAAVLACIESPACMAALMPPASGVGPPGTGPATPNQNTGDPPTDPEEPDDYCQRYLYNCLERNSNGPPAWPFGRTRRAKNSACDKCLAFCRAQGFWPNFKPECKSDGSVPI